MKLIKNMPLLMLCENPNGYKITKKLTDSDLDKLLNKPVIDFSTYGRNPSMMSCEAEKVIGHIKEIIEVGEHYIFGNIEVYDENIKSVDFITHMIQPSGVIIDKCIESFFYVSSYVSIQY